jgi:nitrite reductase/ring-hydroxylating ferredoxin subunit
MIAEEQFVRLAALGDLEEGKGLGVDYDGQLILLTRIGDTIYAVKNICAHRGVPFTFKGQTQIEGCNVRCWAHDYVFDLRSGACTNNSNLSIPTYSVRLEGEDVWVNLSDSKPSQP